MYKVIMSTGRGHIDDQQQVIMDGLAAFEKELKNRQGHYFGGQHPGMLDFMIWPWCERADLLKLFGDQFILKKDRYKKLVRHPILLLSQDSLACEMRKGNKEGDV